MARLLVALACLAAMTAVMAQNTDITLQNEEFMVASDAAVGPQRALLQATRSLTYAPEPCYWSKTNNGDNLVVVIRTSSTFANGKLLLEGRTRNVYIEEGSDLRAKVGAFGKQSNKKTGGLFTYRYTVKLPLSPCAFFKQDLRAKLRAAVRKIKTRSIRSVTITKIA